MTTNLKLAIQAMIILNTITIFASHNAMAFSNISCLRRSVPKQISDVQKISYFGRDPRMTVSDYAARHGLSKTVAAQLFSATGLIICPSLRNNSAGVAMGTAQLTGRKDLITTAAHLFYDDHCNLQPVQKCKFKTLFGKSREISLKASTAKIHDCAPKYAGDDWAIVELEEKVADATPYLVPEVPYYPAPGEALVQPSADATNFKPRGKHVTECSVKNVELYNGTPLMTDCASGYGTSGSAQLTESSEGFVLQAINNKETATDDTNLRASDGKPYDPAHHYNSSATVAGEFFDTLVEMANKQ